MSSFIFIITTIILNLCTAKQFPIINKTSEYRNCFLIDTDELYVKVRLQPVAQTSVLNAISWDNLPLLTMKLSVDRDPMNDEHHNVLAKANYFKLTLIGCYNITNAFTDFNFIAASKTTMNNDKV